MSQELYPTLIAHLIGGMRALRMHGPSNEASIQAIALLYSDIERMEQKGPLQIQFVDRILFINETPVHTRDVNPKQIEALQQDLRARGVGGIEFLPALSEKELKAALMLVATHDKDGLKEALEKLDAKVRLLDAKTIAVVEEGERVEVSSFSFALQTYARAIVGFRELASALKEGDRPFSGGINVVRVVQDLIDFVEKRPDYLLQVLEQRRQNADQMEARYADVHAANTCVYALLIGKLIGIERRNLLDLGTSALLADIGFALLPEEMTERPDALTAADRSMLKSMMLRAIQLMIGRGQLDYAMMRRVLVAYEHHRPHRHPTTKQVVQNHVYSRIVSVVDAYDAMTTERPWRPALSPKEALASLDQQKDTKYDPLVVTSLNTLITAQPTPPEISAG